MTPEQREELKRAALEASTATGSRNVWGFMDQATPYAILSLITQVEALEARLSTEKLPNNPQEWEKVDPAVAFHLIDRHAEGWSDAGAMMVAWADARNGAKVEALTVPQGWKLVPIEPTPVMLERARNAPFPMVLIDSISGRENLRIRSEYAAMLDTAPTIPAIPGTKEEAT